MNAAMRRTMALALGLLAALALAPFAFTQTAHAAASPDSWFAYDIRAEGDADAKYGAGAYITALTGDPEGEYKPGNFWDDATGKNLTLPYSLPDKDGVEHPVVYARIPGGLFATLNANAATELRYLNCANGDIEALWVDKLTKLEHLDCSVNFITEMRLGNCTQLKHLACGHNYLEDLDLSAAVNLEYLDCVCNMIEDTSALQGVASSSLSRVEPQRIDIAGAKVTAKSVTYDAITEYCWEDPETTVTMPDGSSLLPFDWGDASGDYMISSLTPHDSADDNGNGNRAGTYTVQVVGMGDLSLAGLLFGSCNPWCALIGTAEGTFVINQLPLYKANVYLSKYTYVYDGYWKQPTATVKVNDVKQYASEYKKVTYWNASKSAKVNPQNVGTYYAKIEAKASANTKGYVYRAFKINPKATANVKLTALNNGFKASWTKRAVQVDGYEVRYKAKGASAWTVKTVADKNVGSKSFTKLKDKKTYQVQVRTYKVANGEVYYSTWTNVKSVKTK